jgi:K+-sensing histidine kinase KdpD
MKSTLFAPAESYGDPELMHQRKILSTVPMLEVLLNSVNICVFVLNDLRQIVYYNTPFFDFVDQLGTFEIYGKRPGEVFHCIHSNEKPSGCGTTEFCTTCGAVRAILAAQKGTGKLEECRIQTTADVEAGALDVRVWTSPFEFEGVPFTIMSFIDISDEKRRAALERIFFHDVLNTANAMYGHIGLLQLENLGPHMEEVNHLSDSAEVLVEEIKSQRDLKSAEAGRLPINIGTHDSDTILQQVVARFRHHQSISGGTLHVDENSESVSIETDFRLLDRVLSNMIKNALEASGEFAVVTVGFRHEKDHYRFWVHNPEFIARKDQLQIFNRSYTTKGNGRGLGTYSMRLLTENYLNGRITFESSRDQGTTFSAHLPIQINKNDNGWKSELCSYPET